MKSIGINIGKRRCIVCIMDRNGTVLEETGYENTYAAADAFARKAKMEYEKCQAVCESTGNLWIKTYEAFEDRGIPIELSNPMKARAVAEAGVKTDRVGARTLAHLLRTNLIARYHVAERGVRGVRQLLGERNNLVRARTQTINRLHNLLDRYDLNPKDFAQDVWREKALKALDSKSLADPNDDYVLHMARRLRKDHVISYSSIYRIMKGNGLVTPSAAKSRKRKWVRYERGHSNFMWHTDWHIMKDPRFKGLNLITFLDDASRCVTGAALFTEATPENVVAVLRQAIKRFGTLATILSDNGFCFVGVRRKEPKRPWQVTDRSHEAK